MPVGQSIQEAISLPTAGFDHHFFHQAHPYQGLNLLTADFRDQWKKDVKKIGANRAA